MTTIFDTQKIKVANDIAKKITGQDPAYGVGHQETIKTRGVQMVKKTGDIVGDGTPKMSVTEKFIIFSLGIIILAFVLSLVWGG